MQAVTGEARRPSQYLSIQYLRGGAALAVVAYHVVAFHLAPSGWTWFEVGRRGVDVFFVISGFIMFTAARSEAFGEFWRRRLLRIVPLYWLGTALMVAVLLYEKGARPSGSDMLASVLFVPRFSDATPDHINPILYPGWTLQYEMFFYLLFSFGLLARRVVVLPVVLLAGCVLLGQVASAHNAPFLTYTSPLLIEFGAGLLLGRIAAARSLAWLRYLIGPGLALLAAPALPGWGVGIAALLLVTGAVGLEHHRPVRSFATPKLVGDASYALYLGHAPLIQAVSAILAHAGIVLAGSALVPMAVVVTMAALAFGLAIHRWVERPLLRLGNRVWPARRAGSGDQRAVGLKIDVGRRGGA